MTGWRAGLGAGVVVALIVAVWVAVATGDEPTPTTVSTLPTFPPTSTTTPPTTAVPTTTIGTTVTSPPSADTTTDAEARAEEVRLILEDLWFRWFEAIYDNDVEAVQEVVATEERLVGFRDAVEAASYDRPPRREDVVVATVQILRDTSDCLVVFSEIDLSGWQGESAVTAGVDVLWPYGTGWRRATRWSSSGDLWEVDCEAERSDELS